VQIWIIVQIHVQWTKLHQCMFVYFCHFAKSILFG
jgi:hypothetical protein